MQLKIQTRRSAEYDKKYKRYEFCAPQNFSFMKNPKETIDFFYKVISFISSDSNYGKHLFFDISRIQNLSIDALMYLLAIIKNLRSHYRKYTFSGNEPQNEKIRKMFKESGFYNYVGYNGNEPLTRSKDNIQILCGNNADPKSAKTILDYVSGITSKKQRELSYLYDIIVELMSNTYSHAYQGKNLALLRNWYCFIEYNKDENRLVFSFLDTGEGIPKTVRKKWKEKLDFLGIIKESEYVISALSGDFRTSTNDKKHGKGLPAIKKYCNDGLISELRILSSRAFIRVTERELESEELNAALVGTIFNWSIYV